MKKSNIHVNHESIDNLIKCPDYTFPLGKEARKFLENKLKKLGIPVSKLDKDLSFYLGKRPKQLNDVFRRLIESAKNRNMMNNVIINPTNDIKIESKTMRTILCDFDYKTILNQYKDDEQLFQAFKTSFSSSDRTISDEPRSLWKIFSKAVFSSANYCDRFKNITDFINQVDKKNLNDIIDVLVEMGNNIHGLSISLCADCLKELGFEQYFKPDNHIIDILYGISFLSSNDKTNTNVKLACIKIGYNTASHENLPPVVLDKLLWIIGSKKIGREGGENIVSRDEWKAEFIEGIKKKI